VIVPPLQQQQQQQPGQPQPGQPQPGQPQPGGLTGYPPAAGPAPKQP
jgi:hypothetical protein